MYAAAYGSAATACIGIYDTAVYVYDTAVCILSAADACAEYFSLCGYIAAIDADRSAGLISVSADTGFFGIVSAVSGSIRFQNTHGVVFV